MTHTHCESRPPWEIVIKILSAKYIDETSVCVPLTVPAASLLGAGYRVCSTAAPLIRTCGAVDTGEFGMLGAVIGSCLKMAC